MTHRTIVTAIAIGIALAPWRAAAQVGVGFEELAVSTASVPITATVYRPAAGSIEATHCFAADFAMSCRHGVSRPSWGFRTLAAVTVDTPSRQEPGPGARRRQHRRRTGTGRRQQYTRAVRVRGPRLGPGVRRGVRG